jgi:hypothetical protein
MYKVAPYISRVHAPRPHVSVYITGKYQIKIHRRQVDGLPNACKKY